MTPIPFDPKAADEAEFFEWNFADAVTPGDTVDTLVGVTELQGDGALVIAQTKLTGFLVSAKLSAGTPESPYVVRAQVTTVGGETLDLDGYLFVTA